MKLKKKNPCCRFVVVVMLVLCCMVVVVEQLCLCPVVVDVVDVVHVELVVADMVVGSSFWLTIVAVDVDSV